MKIEYNAVKVDHHTEAMKLIKKHEATWISRLRNELVVIIPSGTCNNRGDVPVYNWVWVSSANQDGAFISSGNKTAQQIATTIITGEWNFQPNIKIVLEE
jgi:hypothetical protein